MSHFNEVANEWDSPKKMSLMNNLAKATKKELPLKNNMRILDFGCGTGLFGLEFIDNASHLHGIDTSEGMLKVFDQKVTDLNNVSTELLNLEDQEAQISEGPFDLIISSMTFHHLDHPLETLKKLKDALAPQGKIAIVDLCQEDGSFHPEPKAMGVKHFGFSDETLKDWGEQLGLKTKVTKIHQVEKNDKTYDQFLAVFEPLS